ncbi:MAG: iron complex transport system permease protein [Fimbriimonadaceae bacterium]|nr:iron complex transport system permease protein [Fimbriimonadaceae bacterium]
MLSVVGSSFQALFRNPLADPYVVGVSSGAAVGGSAAIVLGLEGLWGGLGIMGLAFLGGLGSLLLVFGLARRRGVVDVSTLLLAGVVVGSLLAALTTLVLYAAGEDTNKVLRWLLGSMTPMFYDRLVVMAVAAAVGSAVLILQARQLNAFAISESTAKHLGIDTRRLKWIVLVTGTVLAAICVGAVGIIGFLGLVAPHISRRLLGVDWRLSMPGALMIGPTLLLMADVAAQRALPNMELPVGVVTALLGAPFLLVLLRRDA